MDGKEALSALNGAQEAVENYHFWFPDLPLVGLLTNVGACTQILLMMTYLMSRKKEGRRALLSLVPALLTAVFCLGSPLVYIRYALPLTATLPLWFIPCAIQQQ